MLSDATGYSSSYASRYYMQRMHSEHGKRGYIKASLSVSTANQCVITAKTRLGPRNDNIDFECDVFYTTNYNITF